MMCLMCFKSSEFGNGQRCTNTWVCFFSYHQDSMSRNVYTLIPHFYTDKCGLQGYTFFLILIQNIDCGYSLEPPRLVGSNAYPQSMFSAAKHIQNIKLFQLKSFIFFVFSCKTLCGLHC